MCIGAEAGERFPCAGLAATFLEFQVMEVESLRRFMSHFCSTITMQPALFFTQFLSQAVGWFFVSVRRMEPYGHFPFSLDT